MNYIKNRISAALSPQGWRAFVSSVAPHARLLDVGCGNNSPYRVKTQRPDIHYTGLDVGDYNQTAPILADQYIVTSSDGFAAAIEGLAGTMDAVISSHNIEHCDDPERVVRAMAESLKPGGLIYVAFPSEASTTLPSRGGCLNFFDDPTHRELPSFDRIAASLRDCNCALVISKPIYRPAFLRATGALVEPISRLRRQIMIGTWAYHGFESILWARKQ